jgi:hypothetical protein
MSQNYLFSLTLIKLSKAFIIYLQEKTRNKMEKKYLFLIPLAVPLFFGGKAAVNAIRNKRSGSNGHGIKDTVTLSPDSAGSEVMESDLHSDEMRNALQDQNITEQMSIPEYPEINENPVINPDSEMPEREEFSASETSNDQTDNEEYFEGRKLMKGPKGGKYYLNDSGRKVYLKK